MSIERSELLEALHRSLLSQGVSDRDVHEYLDWIEERINTERRYWWILTAVMTLLGIITGGIICLIR